MRAWGQWVGAVSTALLVDTPLGCSNLASEPGSSWPTRWWPPCWPPAGEDVLPIVLLDGKVRFSGTWPSRTDLAAPLGITVPAWWVPTCSPPPLVMRVAPPPSRPPAVALPRSSPQQRRRPVRVVAVDHRHLLPRRVAGRHDPAPVFHRQARVGKTSTACATAIGLTQTGRRCCW